MAITNNTTLVNIFQGDSSFEIPIYQRNYTWDERDCLKFLKDIYENYKLNKNTQTSIEEINYYVGNIIIFTTSDHCIVVDGQQRLTTSLLIYSALRDFALEINAENKQWIESNIKPLISCASLNGNEKNKFKINNIKNQDYLNEILENQISDENNIYFKNYSKILKYISERYDKDENIIDDIFQSMKSTLLVKICIKESDNPNKLFEIINTSGKKLSAVDLIKNYIFFYSTKYAKKIKELLKIYEFIEKNLDNSDKNFISFYRYLIPILSGENKFKLQNENSLEIYYDFKKLFTDHRIFSELSRENYDDVEKIIKTISEHAKIWNFIKNYKPNKSIDKYYYNVFNSSFNTYYSLIHHYLWYRTIQKQNDRSLEMPKILKCVCHLIFSLLFSSKQEKNITREVPNLFHNYLLYLQHNNDIEFEDWLMNVENNLGTLDKEKINQYITTTNMYKISEKKCKWLLIGIEMISTNWESELNNKVLSIEHIMPQTIKDDSSYRYESLKSNDNHLDKAKEWENIIKDTLPNLTIVAKKLNSEMQNKDFDIKKVKLHENSNFLINKKIQEYEHWNQQTIRERSQWLVENIYKLLEL